MRKNNTFIPKFLGVVLFLALVCGGVAAYFGMPKNLASTSVLKSAPTQIPTPTPFIEQLSLLSGTATVSAGGIEKILGSGDTQNITHGTQVETGEKSFAVITYTDGTNVRLGPNTKITIDDSHSKEPVLTQESGSVFVRFKKLLGIRDSISVKTSTALATVRGSAFASFQTKAGAKIVGIEHVVSVYKMDETNQSPSMESEMNVPETKMVVVPAGPMPTDPKTAMQMTDMKLSAEEKLFITLNINTMEMNSTENDFATMAAGVVNPTATPTPTPTPTPLPTPTTPPLPQLNSMPAEGYTRSQVKTDRGSFTMTCMGVARGTKIITDSGNDSTCTNNCTVMPLAEYAKRNNGFAAINGMYFCPADYDWCKDKVNSFDTLFFNSRSRNYLNGPNNVYSTIPFLAIEGNGNPLFKRHSSEWGRDTGIMAGTAGNPLMISGGSNVTGEYSLDAKMQNKAARAAIAQKGNTIYMCVVSPATVPDAASVYQKLGADNAINLDSGGSTAFWVNGSYIFGPGRNLPTAIIFAR